MPVARARGRSTDSLVWSNRLLRQVLTSISLEGWSPIMYALMDAIGPSVIAYFVILLLVGAFFVVNLVVAVIYEVRRTRASKSCCFSCVKTASRAI
jgi:hypothetical protein